MTLTAETATALAAAPVDDCHADTLRALAEASAGGPASASLLARLNPAYPHAATRRALAELQDAGLVERRPHPLTPMLTACALTGAGRRWVRERG
jgi:DNA-binding IclR family transcriptional regulator